MAGCLLQNNYLTDYLSSVKLWLHVQFLHARIAHVTIALQKKVYKKKNLSSLLRLLGNGLMPSAKGKCKQKTHKLWDYKAADVLEQFFLAGKL